MISNSINMLRVLELYSGIGGMHYAMKDLGIPFTIVAAMDINNHANTVYRYNFPDANLLSRNIEGLTSQEWDELRVDVLLMSPPCQPFTRLGKQADSKDPRTRSFFHLLNLIKSSMKKPQFILMENVKGFELSDTRKELVDCLESSGYQFQEFLLTPTQFGIPNARLRYYMVAARDGFGMPFSVQRQERGPRQDLPSVCSCGEHAREETTSVERSSVHKPHCCTQCAINQTTGGKKLPSLEGFLDSKASQCLRFRVPIKTIRRYGFLMDIVYPESTNSCCFTKGYTHQVEGTGSVISHSSQEKMDFVFAKLAAEDVEDEDIDALCLRYFSPREISRLLCFPEDFDFPDDITLKQRYKLLGNSLNVRVVTLLLEACRIPGKSWTSCS